MIREPRIVRDGLLSTLGGIDSGRAPSLLGQAQLAFAVNAQNRGGFPGTRPRLSKKLWSFATSELQDWFEEHILQGVEFYYALSGASKMIVSVGGRILAMSPKNLSGAERMEVVEITPTGQTETADTFTVPSVNATVVIEVADASKIFVGYPIYVGGKLYVVTVVSGVNVTARNINDTASAVIATGTRVIYLDPNAPDNPTAWMEQAEEYHVVQDGQGAAIIYNGASCRRAQAVSDEVPTGTAMVYNEEIGRLCVAVRGNEIAIGDIAPDIKTPGSSVIRFSEEKVVATGGRFRVPHKYGRIVAMEMTANLDRANGQGPMVAFAERGVSAFVLPAQRLAWQNLTYPVQLNTPFKYSATAQASVVPVNSDLYFRSRDGLRTFIYAARDFQTPGNVPISAEVARILKDDDPQLLSRSSAALFDNRLIFTASPAPSTNGTYHRGLCVMDFDQLNRMGQKAPPVYDGLWTGLRVTKVVVGTFNQVERCFVFAQNPTTLENELWELHRDVGFDDVESSVTTTIETRSMDFKTPLELKELWSCGLWVDQVRGTVEFTLQYRPDDYHCWVDWGTQEICQALEDCSEDGEGEDCKELQTFNPGYRTRIEFGQPPDTAETVDNKPARNFYHAQVRLTWVGQCRVRKLLVKARQLEEPLATMDKEQ